MAEADVIRALDDKRSELNGMVERLEQRLAEHRAGLSHLEGVLRLFDPGVQSEEVGSVSKRAQRACWCRRRRRYIPVDG